MKRLLMILAILLALGGGFNGCKTKEPTVLAKTNVVQTHEELYEYIGKIVEKCTIVNQRMISPVHAEIFATLEGAQIDFLVQVQQDQVLGIVIKHKNGRWEVILMKNDGKYERLSQDNADAFVKGRKFDLLFEKVFGKSV